MVSKTGNSTASVPQSTSVDIDVAVNRAREAAKAWRDVSLKTRLKLIGTLKNLLIEQIDSIVEAIVQATGKPPVEALASDILVCVDMLDYYEKEAEKILSEERRTGVGLYRLNRFRVSYEPYGVVLVIAPWNHPLQLSLVPLACALIAGNVVILKPSELTPGIGQIIEDLAREADFPPGVLQVIQGGGDVGQRLLAAAPDFVFFTGSLHAGRLVMKAAAEHPVPVHLELGGKDPMIVFADANLKRAASGAIWAAFAHAGQNCVALERLYVERTIHDSLVALLVEEASKLRNGSDINSDFGPLTQRGQIDRMESQIAEAIAAGAKPVLDFKRRGNFIGPVILTNVNHGMKIMQEESFCPLLPIMAFDSEEDAVRLANDSNFGLNASIWTDDRDRAQRIADRLEVGSVAINDVLKNIGNPSTPFGGVKRSGFGRYHGPEGLRAFCQTKSVMSNLTLLKKEPNWFPYGENVYNSLKTLIYTLHSDAPRLKKLTHLVRGVRGVLRGKNTD